MAEGLRRGDIVLAVAPGEYGKPRPSVVVQRDFPESLESAIVCPLTSDLLAAYPIRPTIKPSDQNALQKESQVMIDKIAAIRLSRIRERIG